MREYHYRVYIDVLNASLSLTPSSATGTGVVALRCTYRAGEFRDVDRTEL